MGHAGNWLSPRYACVAVHRKLTAHGKEVPEPVPFDRKELLGTRYQVSLDGIDFQNAHEVTSGDSNRGLQGVQESRRAGRSAAAASDRKTVQAVTRFSGRGVKAKP
jgi:hypothetical protein